MKMKEEFVLEDFVKGENRKKKTAHSKKKEALEYLQDTSLSEMEQESQQRDDMSMTEEEYGESDNSESMELLPEMKQMKTYGEEMDILDLVEKMSKISLAENNQRLEKDKLQKREVIVQKMENEKV
jgi:hypothetical protein